MNPIIEHRKFVASQIEKSFGVENDIEKAHNVGDVHPNGKWVWTEYAPGKFDWRNKKKEIDKQAEDFEEYGRAISESIKEKQQKSDKLKAQYKKEHDDLIQELKNKPNFKDRFKEVLEEVLGKKFKENSDELISEINLMPTPTLKKVIRKFEESSKEKKFTDECEKMSLASLKYEANSFNNTEEFRKIAKGVLAKRNKERKNWLEERSDDFTDEEVNTYLTKYNPQAEPSAVVVNTWNNFMGRIGNTSATIQIGKGKPKPLDSYNTPDWRPIGKYSYSFMGYRDWETVSGVIQSWEDVEKCLSDTENMTISIYKHPKQ